MKRINNRIAECNIEKGSPNREEALNRLKNCIAQAKRENIKFLIIIHGYGSTGKGGIIKSVIRKYLKDTNFIKRYIAGEELFGLGDLRAYNLKKEEKTILSDYRGNKGITLIII